MSQSKPPTSLRPPGWAEMDTGNVTPRPLNAPPETLREERAQLLLLNGTNAGQVFTIEPAQIETVIGRGRAAQVCVEDVEASRAHSKITVSEFAGSKRYFVGSRDATKAEMAMTSSAESLSTTAFMSAAEEPPRSPV